MACLMLRVRKQTQVPPTLLGVHCVRFRIVWVVHASSLTDVLTCGRGSGQAGGAQMLAQCPVHSQLQRCRMHVCLQVFSATALQNYLDLECPQLQRCGTFWMCLMPDAPSFNAAGRLVWIREFPASALQNTDAPSFSAAVHPVS
jgi:hypothetical protein